MATAIKAQPAAVSKTSEYDIRVLFLSGRWTRGGSDFGFRATVYVEKDGSADGAFYWRAYKVNGKPMNYFGTEWVHGGLKGLDVELEGHECEAGLATDVYKITLSSGGEAGTFAGITRANARDWSGRIEGTFQFRNRKK